MATLNGIRYITDENGEKISVILPISEYERLIEYLEDIEDVKLFDEAKADNAPSMLLDDYVRGRQQT